MKMISRRDFLKCAAAGAVTTAAAGVLAGCGTETASTSTPEPTEAAVGSWTFNYANTIKWDAEYDVLVIGYGGAGAVASITAAREGASVLMVEKAPYGQEGGNTHYSCNFMAGCADPDVYLESVIKEHNYLYTDTCDEETMRAAAVAFNENPAWLESIGGVVTIGEARDNGSRFDSLDVTMSDGTVIGTGIRSDKKYWNLIRTVVLREDNVTIWYSSPAKHLIQDPMTKTILGAVVERDGTELNVRAKNGVIMCLGGFEWNTELQQNYLNRPKIYPYGSQHNTGDGIYMAQEVGAVLWHMSNLSGPDIAIWNPTLDLAYYLDKDTDAKDRNRDQRANPLTGDSMILAGPDGSRFMSESAKMSHGRVSVAGEMLLIHPPTPMYAIFDESTRLAKKFVPQFLNDDNSDILIDGWAVQAETIDELAEKLGMENLAAQVAEYNTYAVNGLDSQFGRDPEQMEPIVTPPYYAIPVVQAVYNTQGGARRNGNAEVLDANGNAIPHLYSAGEFGAIWPAYYGGGMNIAETCAFGRIAGINASAAKDDDLTYTLTAVEQSTIDNSQYEKEVQSEIELGENEYLGESFGVGGPIRVVVKYVDGVIEDVRIVEIHDTEGICDKALSVPQMIVDNNSLDVDATSGASVTRLGIINAVKDALLQAGWIEPEATAEPEA